MSDESKCPSCGADPASVAGESWQCGTYVAHDSNGLYLDESKDCLKCQLANRQARIAALEAENTKLKEERDNSRWGCHEHFEDVQQMTADAALGAAVRNLKADHGIVAYYPVREPLDNRPLGYAVVRYDRDYGAFVFAGNAFIDPLDAVKDAGLEVKSGE